MPSDTDGDNSRWIQVANDVVEFQSDYPRRAVFIQQNAYSRADWMGLAAVPIDLIGAPFFGTKTLNIIIVATPDDPKADSTFGTLASRLIAAYRRFPAHRTSVFVDTATLAKTEGKEFSTADFATKVENICSDLASVGFFYGGTVNYDTASASMFQPLIDQFINDVS